MNTVKSFFDQQYGFSKWNSYESFLPRLRCTKEDDYHYLINSSDSYYCDTPIFACKFSQQSGKENLLALANEDGKLAIHDVQNKQERIGIQAHNNAIFDLTWLFQEMKLVTASGDHCIKQFDVSDAGITQERTFYGHTRSVKSITYRKDDPRTFATGGRDGKIIVWDTRCEMSQAMIGRTEFISNSHVGRTTTPRKIRKKNGTPSTVSYISKSVTGLVFQDYNTLVSCGAGDGAIKIWDLRKNYSLYTKDPLPKYSIPHPGKSAKNGYSNLLIDNSGVKLYANCLDNNIYCYNISAYDSKPVITYTGLQNNTFYVKSSLSRNGEFLISGSSDQNAYIWKTNESRPLFKLTGHSAEVTCVAWCDYNENVVVVTCSDDVKHKLWRIGTEKLPDNWQSDGRGQTEILVENNKKNIKSFFKRVMGEEIDCITPKKFIIQCEKCKVATYGLKYCENCNVTSSKRKSNELTNENKRLHTEYGPKRLFANLMIDVNGGSIEEEIINSCFSPTLNLPNFVEDGVAPHINYSPPKKRKCDWLTKLRIEKKFKVDMEMNNQNGISYNNSLQSLKLDSTPSKSKYKHGYSGSKSPLLRYFKLTNSTDRHSNKSNGFSGSNVHTQSPQASQ